jgi:hypothetical protein
MLCIALYFIKTQEQLFSLQKPSLVRWPLRRTPSLFLYTLPRLFPFPIACRGSRAKIRTRACLIQYTDHHQSHSYSWLLTTNTCSQAHVYCTVYALLCKCTIHTLSNTYNTHRVCSKFLNGLDSCCNSRESLFGFRVSCKHGLSSAPLSFLSNRHNFLFYVSNRSYFVQVFLPPLYLSFLIGTLSLLCL